MKKYNKVKVLRISEQQHDTLIKMKHYKVDVCRFIRNAISEKINREYSDIIPKQKKEPDYFLESINKAILKSEAVKLL